MSHDAGPEKQQNILLHRNIFVMINFRFYSRQHERDQVSDERSRPLDDVGDTCWRRRQLHSAEDTRASRDQCPSLSRVLSTLHYYQTQQSNHCSGESHSSCLLLCILTCEDEMSQCSASFSCCRFYTRISSAQLHLHSSDSLVSPGYCEN